MATNSAHRAATTRKTPTVQCERGTRLTLFVTSAAPAELYTLLFYYCIAVFSPFFHSLIRIYMISSLFHERNKSTYIDIYSRGWEGAKMFLFVVSFLLGEDSSSSLCMCIYRFVPVQYGRM